MAYRAYWQLCWTLIWGAEITIRPCSLQISEAAGWTAWAESPILTFRKTSGPRQSPGADLYPSAPWGMLLLSTSCPDTPTRVQPRNVAAEWIWGYPPWPIFKLPVGMHDSSNGRHAGVASLSCFDIWYRQVETGGWNGLEPSPPQEC